MSKRSYLVLILKWPQNKSYILWLLTYTWPEKLLVAVATVKSRMVNLFGRLQIFTVV